MTNPKYAHILMIIDRSGSMADIKSAAEEGVNGFVKTQQELATQGMRITLSLAQFDDKFDWVDQMRVIADPNLTEQPAFFYHLKPRNATALRDAIGKAVTEDGDRLAAMSENDRPGKVVVVIQTDGKENASREWTYESIEKLIDQQKNQYAWEFVFLSSDLSSAKFSRDIGIRNTMEFDNTAAGASSAYQTSGLAVRSYLSGANESVDLQLESTSE
ncbi:MAG TPA: VWA domain-containing protein [Gammaproteobacteria bacterium]|nr:VWA domain-containing protein [Gammaproteobacteria bacterium]